MSIGSYFVSEDAEKAARWDDQQEFLELKRHRDTIVAAMEKVGKALGDFGYVLQHREGCSFDARPHEIVVGREQRMVARVEPTQLDWQTVSRLITDYISTTQRVAQLEPRFPELK